MTCSTSSSRSSGSHTSSLSRAEKQKRDCKFILSRPTMLGRFGDLGIGRVCTTSNPVNYLLPGVTTGTYVLYAIASVRIYHHNTQLSSNFNLNHIGALRFVNNNNNNGHQWVYSHLKGTLVFGYDKPCAGTEASPTVEPILALDRGKPEANGEWWFQLVDDETDKVAWKFKLPISPGSKFNYELDRPFFHVFQGSVSCDSVTLLYTN